MAERTSYVPGTPSWIDIGVPDTAKAAAFYGDLLGWSADFTGAEESGGYVMFTLRGKNVAGLGPQQNPDMPPFWTVYVTVEDAAATSEAVTAAGGTVVVAPMDIFEAGTMAVFQDSVGSFVSGWQPKEHIGCQLVNEPGTFTWNELATTDLTAARDFYTTVFGWGLDAGSSGDDATTFTLGGDIICGAHTAGEGEFPAWSIWLSVDDCDASAKKATQLGGNVLVPPNDMSFGRGSVVMDDQGAVFGIGAMGG